MVERKEEPKKAKKEQAAQDVRYRWCRSGPIPVPSDADTSWSTHIYLVSHRSCC